jgi:hypothetical protein
MQLANATVVPALESPKSLIVSLFLPLAGDGLKIKKKTKTKTKTTPPCLALFVCPKFLTPTPSTWSLPS